MKKIYKKYILGLTAGLALLSVTGCNDSKDKKEANNNKIEQSKKAKEKAEDNKTDKEAWHKQYDGTKYNTQVIDVQNASNYASYKNLSKEIKTVDNFSINIKHVEASTQYKDLNGKVHNAPNGKSFLIATFEIQNNGDASNTLITLPNIEFMSSDNKLIKEKDILRDDDIMASTNDDVQKKIITGASELEAGAKTCLNVGYVLPTDNVRYTELKDAYGTLNHYSDLNDAVFSIGKLGTKGNDKSNVGLAFEDQQENE